MTLLAVERIEARHGLLEAVRGVSLTVQRNEILALVGANGAGKTTLLRTLAGAHPAAAGRILFAGEDIGALPVHQRARRGIALVPEGRRLFGHMTVEENLLLGRSAARGAGPDRWTIDRVIAAFPNLAARRKALCGTLSGGEQQAVAIGRALMGNPTLLLLDEVSLGLSPLAVDRAYAALAGLVDTTIILVEQDLSRAMQVAGRVACMLEGRIVLEGRTAELTRPQVIDAYFGLGPARRGPALAVAP